VMTPEEQQQTRKELQKQEESHGSQAAKQIEKEDR
jgi:hypothetical protein